MKQGALVSSAVLLVSLGCGQESARPASSAAGGGAASAGAAGSAGGADVALGGQSGGGASGSPSASAGATASAGAGAGGSSGAGGSAFEECAGSDFAWPDGAKAAVSLTYDDGMPSQLHNAAPALVANGLVATFFLSESFGGFEQRKPEYQALVEQGFEMASHTVEHPCFGLTPDLKTYDEASLAAELDQNVQTLRALGVNGALTFAYPCGNREYGEPKQSYVPLIEERFLAARGVDCCAQAVDAVDLFDVNTNWPSEAATATDVTAPVDQAIAAGTWLVFGFHAVGAAPGEWSAVSQDAHDALVEHLVAKRGELWVATFGTVADYVKRCR